MLVTEEADAPISAREAARLLGVSERTIWRYRDDGRLTAREGLVRVEQQQPGLVFSRADVLNLKRQREGSSEPTE